MGHQQNTHIHSWRMWRGTVFEVACTDGAVPCSTCFCFKYQRGDNIARCCLVWTVDNRRRQSSDRAVTPKTAISKEEDVSLIFVARDSSSARCPLASVFATRGRFPVTVHVGRWRGAGGLAELLVRPRSALDCRWRRGWACGLNDFQARANFSSTPRSTST